MKVYKILFFKIFFAEAWKTKKAEKFQETNKQLHFKLGIEKFAAVSNYF